MRALIWFRADLRVHDNPALAEAVRVSRRGAVAVFVICPDQWREHDWAPVRVEFLLRTLVELRDALADLRIPLLIETHGHFDGVPSRLLQLARRHECDAVFFNREYELNEAERDRDVCESFETAGLEARLFTDQLILPPGSLRTGAGGFYTVFTPFRKAWTKRVEAEGWIGPTPKPRRLDDMIAKPGRMPKTVVGFPPSGIAPDLWPAGATEAQRRLRIFIRDHVDSYAESRDIAADDETSRLSPYLAVGAISTRQCLHAAIEHNDGRIMDGGDGVVTWISELIWRSFYRHVLVGFPRVCKHRPFKVSTDKVRWREDPEGLEAWREGRTGIPLVDAGMRQLAATGWMHNRLRMVTAMFLTKQLLIDWRAGEQHFMQNLIDGDLASNNGGWQWSASTGTDAAPYFRVFNPIRQSERFDADGRFIRTWVPELKDVEGKAIHDPTRLPPLLRTTIDYPDPIVDLKKARQRAIDAFKRIK